MAITKDNMYSLFEIKKLIEGIADKQPNVNTVVKSGDIYELNTSGDVKYGAFCLTQQVHTEEEGFRTYNFYMFVVDRLLSNGLNKTAAQSNAIEVLSNIINTLRANDDLEINSMITYQTFTQRFSSECAGAYCSVSITVPIELCYEDYE